MVSLGRNVALIRDLTDTMYNPERPPGVSHFEGTDLVIAHVEKYWCPTFTSSDITGKPAFHFKLFFDTCPSLFDVSPYFMGQASAAATILVPRIREIDL